MRGGGGPGSEVMPLERQWIVPATVNVAFELRPRACREPCSTSARAGVHRPAPDEERKDQKGEEGGADVVAGATSGRVSFHRWQRGHGGWRVELFRALQL